MINSNNLSVKEVSYCLMNSSNIEEMHDYLEKGSLSLSALNDLLEELVHKVRTDRKAYTSIDISAMRLLLERGAEPLFKCRSAFQTIFDHVVYYKDSDMIMLFLEYMEDPMNVKVTSVDYPIIIKSILDIALENGFEDVFDFILEKEPNIHTSKDNRGNSLLHKIATMENVKMTEIILGHGVDLEAKNIFGQTPLFCAVQYDMIEQVSILLQYGANFATTDCSKYTLLHIPYVYDVKVQLELYRMLLDVGCDPNIFSEAGKSPLQILPTTGPTPNTVQYVELLISRGADLNIRNVFGDTILHLSAETDNAFPALECFMTRGANPRILNNRNESFIDVFRMFHFKDVRVMLKRFILADVAGKFKFSVVSSNSYDSQFETACRKELHRLKTRKIGKSPVSFLTIINSDERRVAKFLQNDEELSVICKQCSRIFPKYYSDVEMSIEAGIRRMKAEIVGAKFFMQVVHKRLNYYALEKLLEFIPTADLENLKKCLDYKEDELEVK